MDLREIILTSFSTLAASQFLALFTLETILLSQTTTAEGSAIFFTTPPLLAPIQLRLVRACDGDATLEWFPTDTNAAVDLSLSKCELTYTITGHQGSQIIDVFPDPNLHTFSLFNLSQGFNYSVFMVCDSSLKTKDISFISGSVCVTKHFNTNQTAYLDKNAVTSYVSTSSYDAIEWPIAISFAIVGLIICGVVAFYMWKKYQRRQRILRIFRQGQNDPFQALYSPTQDSYSF
ncbi:unnamed protein product [Lymnaea stagnalis]|uniref:Fibronectin type-III domain-containing protein n=1 Tax=Lymnaea stagnalis TaxID=6523 RepID=A0AAV2I6E5_LYMST